MNSGIQHEEWKRRHELTNKRQKLFEMWKRAHNFRWAAYRISLGQTSDRDINKYYGNRTMQRSCRRDTTLNIVMQWTKRRMGRLEKRNVYWTKKTVQVTRLSDNRNNEHTEGEKGRNTTGFWTITNWVETAHHVWKIFKKSYSLEKEISSGVGKRVICSEFHD